MTAGEPIKQPKFLGANTTHVIDANAFAKAWFDGKPNARLIALMALYRRLLTRPADDKEKA